MSDQQNMETAYKLIEAHAGDESLQHLEPTFADLMFDVRNFGPDDGGKTFRALSECGDWAVEIALKRYLDWERENV